MSVAIQPIHNFVNDRRDQGGIRFEIGLSIRGDLAFDRIIELDEIVANSAGRLLLLFGSEISERCATGRTELVAIGEGSRTSETALEAMIGLSVGRLDAVMRGDVIVELLIAHARVDLDHVCVDVPAGTMFDCLFGQPFTNPSRDRSLTEVVRVDAIAIDASTIGKSFDLSSCNLVLERAVIVVFDVFEFVQQRCVVDIPTRMVVQPRRDVAFRPRDRDRSRCILDIRVGVDRDRRQVARQIHIGDSQRNECADPEARVCKQGDQRGVASVLARIEECINLIISQEVLRIDRSNIRAADMDVSSPRFVSFVEEPTQGLSVVPQRAVSESPIVFEIKEEGVDIVLIHLDERDVGSLRGETESIESVGDRSFVDRSADVPLSNDLHDGIAIAIVDVSCLEFAELSLVPFVVSLHISCVSHTRYNGCGDYSRCDDNPCGTISELTVILFENITTERPISSCDSTASDRDGRNPFCIAVDDSSGGVPA